MPNSCAPPQGDAARGHPGFAKASDVLEPHEFDDLNMAKASAIFVQSSRGEGGWWRLHQNTRSVIFIGHPSERISWDGCPNSSLTSFPDRDLASSFCADLPKLNTGKGRMSEVWMDSQVQHSSFAWILVLVDRTDKADDSCFSYDRRNNWVFGRWTSLLKGFRAGWLARGLVGRLLFF